ncbi:hypothetical protein L0244_16355, partial [bacterium]|nr:hypothetical protein [bacterium]
ETRWRRPGGMHYTSAVTNHFGKDELRVFSTEAHPFETEKAYTKFQAFTLLNFDGDFHAAAKILAEKGYGK